eukprot:CAMPEP_0175647438 /NCGR_PEP_ID=MMETSP0097-20121207/7826_1 /TAXON_ID=311494 /ORGANISM="Alexandrium monilatum, Strain CCMP3105" /LENGTH=453 /DNA_ID=CAMNT_0016953345 /DNA_START=67 /DNA_END=1425 /DNA_ORIENTATION=+
MVQLFITADANASLAKLARQMESMGLLPEVNWHEHKVFCDVDVRALMQKVPCLDMAERAFLCLRHEELDKQHPLVVNTDYALLQQWVREADWPSALQHMSLLHGVAAGAVWRWHVDCRRRAPKGSRVRELDGLVVKQKVREALYEVLGPLGCKHDSMAPTMQVFVFVSPRLALVGLPVLQRLPRKGTFPHKGLHHATAWGLGATARPRSGEVVVDPMVGKGIVLLEAAVFWPESFFVGVDVSPEQLAKARDNTDAVGTGSHCSLLLGDARWLPLADNSTDVVLCDLPYGLQYGEVSHIPDLYRAVLPEITRILRPGGRAALLTSEEFEGALTEAASSRRSQGAALRVVEVLRFRFGGHRDRRRCVICCFVRREAADADGPADGVAAFDWALRDALEEDPDLTFKDLKPSLMPFRPWRSREDVEPPPAVRPEACSRQAGAAHPTPPASATAAAE